MSKKHDFLHCLQLPVEMYVCNLLNVLFVVLKRDGNLFTSAALTVRIKTFSQFAFCNLNRLLLSLGNFRPTFLWLQWFHHDTMGVCINAV